MHAGVKIPTCRIASYSGNGFARDCWNWLQIKASEIL